MNSKQLERLLTRLSGYAPGEIDQRMRPLRAHELIPHGPVGRHAPDLEPLHVALCLLALVARRASDAGPTLVRAMSLRCIPHPEALDVKFEELAPAIAIAVALGPSVVRRIEVAADGRMAWLDAFDRRFHFTDNPAAFDQVALHPESYDTQGASYLGHAIVFGTGAIERIHDEATDDTEAGYADRYAGATTRHVKKKDRR